MSCCWRLCGRTHQGHVCQQQENSAIVSNGHCNSDAVYAQADRLTKERALQKDEGTRRKTSKVKVLAEHLMEGDRFA